MLVHLSIRTGKGLVSFTMKAHDVDLPQLEGLGAKNWNLVSAKVGGPGFRLVAIEILVNFTLAFGDVS